MAPKMPHGFVLSCALFVWMRCGVDAFWGATPARVSTAAPRARVVRNVVSVKEMTSVAGPGEALPMNGAQPASTADLSDEIAPLTDVFMKSLTEGAEMSGSDIMIATLELAGVEHTFAYPGGASLEIHQSLSKSTKIRNILCRHEQGEIFAAEGYAKCTAKVGVAIATSGPGATNLITGIADAMMDSVPLLCITGQVPQALIGLNSFQEINMLDIVKPITKAAYQITSPDDVARTVLEALHVARSGRPGPVLVDFPKNLQQAKARAAYETPMPHAYAPETDASVAVAAASAVAAARGFDPQAMTAAANAAANDYVLAVRACLANGGKKNPRYKAVTYVQNAAGVVHPARATPPATVRAILDHLRNSSRPLLYVGGGCADCADELNQFIERTGVPVVQTLMALGTVPASDERNFGMLGMHGTVASNYAVHNSDLLLAFGVRFDDRVTGKVEQFAQHATIVHVDVDAREIGKIKAVDIRVVADVGVLLREMNTMIDTEEQRTGKPCSDRPPAHGKWVKRLQDENAKTPMHYKTKEIGGLIRPEYAITRLSEICAKEIPDPEDLIVSTGVGQHQMWAAQHFKFQKERCWLTSGGLGSMGFGLPSALGAAVAKPSATVIDIDGDGSFQMNIQELATISVEKLNTKIVILNNQVLGMVFQWENTFYRKNHAHSELSHPEKPGEMYPDFVTIAEGYGVPAVRVTDEAGMVAAFETMIRTPGPFLVDVVVSDNHVYPMIPAGKGFADVMHDDPVPPRDECPPTQADQSAAGDAADCADDEDVADAYGSLEDNKKVQMTVAEAALKKGGRGEPGSY